MGELLQGFPLSTSSDIKPTENGFLVTEGNHRLRARVVPGSAIGWEQGGEGWLAQRDLWMKAIWASPRVAAVQASDWMGISKMNSSAPDLPDEGCGGCVETFGTG